MVRLRSDSHTSGSTRRIVAALAALVSVTTLMLVGATPARADSAFTYTYLQNRINYYRCLATDYSTRVYTYAGCDGPQRWIFQSLYPAYHGQYLVRNEATQLCLMQFDYTRVISASCNGADIGQRWRLVGLGIQSSNTHGWLGVPLYGDTVRLFDYSQDWYDRV